MGVSLAGVMTCFDGFSLELWDNLFSIVRCYQQVISLGGKTTITTATHNTRSPVGAEDFCKRKGISWDASILDEFGRRQAAACNIVHTSTRMHYPYDLKDNATVLPLAKADGYPELSNKPATPYPEHCKNQSKNWLHVELRDWWRLQILSTSKRKLSKAFAGIVYKDGQVDFERGA
jgi:hypothetical protein